MSVKRLAPTIVAIAGLGLLFAPAPAFAQGKGGAGNNPYQGGGKLPSREEIEKKAKEFLDKAETQTAVLEGFARITYKAIPTSAEEIGRTIGEEYKGQLPKGVDIDSALKQFGPQIQEALNTYLSEPVGWKFEALEDLKWKSKKIPKGEYNISLDVDGEQLRTLILTKGEKGKKDFLTIPIHFGVEKKQQDTFPKLKFEFKPVVDKKNPDKVSQFNLSAEFLRCLCKTREAFKVEETKKKDDAKKDEKKSD